MRIDRTHHLAKHVHTVRIDGSGQYKVIRVDLEEGWADAYVDDGQGIVSATDRDPVGDEFVENGAIFRRLRGHIDVELEFEDTLGHRYRFPLSSATIHQRRVPE